ncbi:abc transporter [Ophiostoma piceae UAMH 11346]|uniref:Abc transporter n=1 Tax=Ophiostoma piceae (strain UAMH 11346) TaxID=1262450 RepID=S3BRG7_OPHP1|nr:abc transporter [Ophiostoma piceae UAMH 11346]
MRRDIDESRLLQNGSHGQPPASSVSAADPERPLQSSNTNATIWTARHRQDDSGSVNIDMHDINNRHNMDSMEHARRTSADARPIELTILPKNDTESPTSLPSPTTPDMAHSTDTTTEKGQSGRETQSRPRTRRRWWRKEAIKLEEEDAASKKKVNPFAIKTETKTKFKDFWRIFSYSTPMDRVLIVVASLASICTGVTMPLMNVVFGRVFSNFSNSNKIVTPESYMHEILACVRFLIYIFIARLVLGYIAFLGFKMSSMRISAAIRLEYMRCLLAQPVSTLDLLPPGQTAAVITMAASTLQLGISEKLSTLLQSTTLVISAIVISFYYSWSLTLVTSSGTVFIIIVYAVTTPMLVKIMNQVQDIEIKAATVASEIFGSIRMVDACGAESKMADRYDECADQSRQKGMRMSPVIACQQTPVFFAIYATFALSFWYSLNEYMKGEIDSPQTLVIVLFSVMMMTSAIGGITSPLSGAARAATSATMFYAMIDAPKPMTSGFGDGTPEAAAARTGDITLENVHFVYPMRPDIKILDDLTVTFPSGKMTAIVGPSGSGKSTVVSLIERWYELEDPDSLIAAYAPASGRIAAGGVSLKDLDRRWWRTQVGLVQQEPFLFNDTIFKNVAFGLVGTPWEDESEDEKRRRVEDACREAFADEFVARLPQGYKTVVGDGGGLKLSGGQRQRLAIARAIIKQPSVLVLDEATSAIDVRSEQIVQAALDRASQNRTTITIAHRLSTVRKADNIVVMRKGGKVAEQGTHAELMARGEGGAYHALATAQQLIREKVEEGDDEESSSTSKDKLVLEGRTEVSSPYTHDRKSVDLHDIATTVRPESIVGSRADGLGTTVVGADDVAVDADIDIEGATGVDKRRKKKEPKERERSFLTSFFLLLREQKAQWPWYIIMAFGALIAGASSPLQSWLFAILISLFSFLAQEELLTVLTNFWCLMFTMLAIAVGASYFALGWSATTTAFNITHFYRKEYLRNIINQPISFFDNTSNSVGALTARLATDPSQLQQLLGMNLAFVAISVLNVVGCLAVSFAFGWKLTLVTVITTMPIMLGAAFIRLRYEQQFEKATMAVFAESAQFATESVGAFRTVAALTLENGISDRYEKLLQDHIRGAFLKSGISTFVFALSDSISLLCMAFVLWYGGKLLSTGEYYSFQYVVVYIAVLQGGMGAGQWLSFGPNIAQASVAANRILNLRQDEKVEAPLVPLNRPDPENPQLGDDNTGVKLEFRDVHFRYPTRDAPVLNGLDMTIEKGQFAAVVGYSGSGKSTIISLLERFYKPSSGDIFYNGQRVDDVILSDYRRDISLVAQEPSLFDGTLRENILLGISGNDLLNEELHAACQAAGIHDFIQSLPDGYNTEVGSKGVALSGGQKQRVSIARALVRKPRLLLLDEATSNLDAETEKKVQAIFERDGSTKKNVDNPLSWCTMVVVAHRLATIQKADVIFVLGDGKVLEKGSHASLLAQRGVYYQMCQAQALDQ